MAFLFLIISFSVPSQADIMSKEDRILFEQQQESTPIGDEDPWEDLHSVSIPDENNSTEENDLHTINQSEVSNQSLVVTIAEILLGILIDY